MPIDRRQFAQTILEDQHKLIAYVLARGGAHQVAEDVVQDVLALALERMETFNDADHLRAWCREAARRTFHAHLRRDNRQPPAIENHVLDLLDPHFHQLDETDGSAALEALEQCLSGISPHARRIVDARYQQGLTGQSLADAVGRKFNTVYSTLARAHQALADCVRQRLAGAGP
jgi:RNA polymerase sigma factor (sigma-70 family)